MAEEKESFPFVEPPPHWKNLDDTECLPGTRWWVTKGFTGGFRQWLYDVLDEYKDNLIPLQWAPEFVGVTRAAVYKRAKAGKLTVFSFVLMAPTPGFKQKARLHARLRFDYVTVSECDAWGDAVTEKLGAAWTRKGLDYVARIANKEARSAIARYRRGRQRRDKNS